MPKAPCPDVGTRSLRDLAAGSLPTTQLLRERGLLCRRREAPVHVQWGRSVSSPKLQAARKKIHFTS